ncbi:MAG: hypothetical protein RRY79_08085 [Clostridia bacterium]
MLKGERSWTQKKFDVVKDYLDGEIESIELCKKEGNVNEADEGLLESLKEVRGWLVDCRG